MVHELNVAPAPQNSVEVVSLAEHLAKALDFQTVSLADDANLRADQFHALHKHLRDHLLSAHAMLKLERIGNRSLLYSCPGSDLLASPIQLMAYQDIVQRLAACLTS